MATQIKIDESALEKALVAWYGLDPVKEPWILDKVQKRDARKMIRAYLKHAPVEASS